MGFGGAGESVLHLKNVRGSKVELAGFRSQSLKVRSHGRVWLVVFCGVVPQIQVLVRVQVWVFFRKLIRGGGRVFEIGFVGW